MAPMPDEIVFISICLKQQYGEDVVDRHASVHFVSNIISDLNKPNDIGWIRQSYKQKKKKERLFSTASYTINTQTFNYHDNK